MSHEKSHATILIGAPEIRTAESVIQEFTQIVPYPLSKKAGAGSGNETSYRAVCSLFLFKRILLLSTVCL